MSIENIDQAIAERAKSGEPVAVRLRSGLKLVGTIDFPQSGRDIVVLRGGLEVETRGRTMDLAPNGMVHAVLAHEIATVSWWSPDTP